MPSLSTFVLTGTLFVGFGLYIALGAAVLYGLYRFKKTVDSVPDPTREQIKKYISDFLAETGGDYDWDDFTTFPLKDPELDKIRKECSEIQFDYPSKDKNHWCNDAGVKKLEEIHKQIDNENT